MAIHSPRKLTYEDFDRFPDDGQRHEILDGEHVVTPAPVTLHQDLLAFLHLRIGGHVEAQTLGKVYFAPLGVQLAVHDIVQPDLLFVSNERLRIIGPTRLEGAPDLVVEVLSPTTRRRDLGLKRSRYEKLGVVEYWIVDPKAGSIQVLRRSGEGFLPPVVLSSEKGDRVATPLLPGLEISLRELFTR